MVRPPAINGIADALHPFSAVQDTEDLLPAFQLLHQMFLGYPPCQLYLCPFEKIILSFYIRT